MANEQGLLKENERLDDLHRNGYMLIQNPHYFCFGVDAVLLSGFACVNGNETVLDLCTGTGVVPILLCGKYNPKKVVAIEIQPECVEMAKRSVALNGLSHKIEILTGDIRGLKELVKPSSFDCITVNPPYMAKGGGIINEDSPKAVARHELLLSLEEVILGAAASLRPGGRFYMVHRPQRLTDILYFLRIYDLEPKRIRFVHPYCYKKPNLVLVEAVRGGKPMVNVMEPLIIYNEDGSYTEETMKIYYE